MQNSILEATHPALPAPSAGNIAPARAGVASVGNGFGLFAYHLHFDISNTAILKEKPGNWPAPSSNPDPPAVRAQYVDPKAWLILHRATPGNPPKEDPAPLKFLPSSIYDSGPKPSSDAVAWYVIVPSGVRVCKDHGISAELDGSINYGTKLFLENNGGIQDGFRWGQVSGGQYHGCWLAINKADPSETYVSTNQPQ